MDILRWAGEEFGDDLIVTASFGDAVLVHLVSRAIPDAEVVLLDTGYLFAETTWFAERLRTPATASTCASSPARRRRGRPVAARSPTAAARPARSSRCSGRSPARAWVTGLRRADSPTRADAPIVHLDPFRGVTKINPLATWSDDDVAHYKAIELLPEHPLTDAGYASIGCWPCTRPVAEGETPGRGGGQAPTRSSAA